MSQKFFQIIRPVHVHLKTDKVDLKKRPPWKKFFLHFFSINSSSRHEKRCQMLRRLFWLFQCSKNPLCLASGLVSFFVSEGMEASASSIGDPGKRGILWPPDKINLFRSRLNSRDPKSRLFPPMNPNWENTFSAASW